MTEKKKSKKRLDYMASTAKVAVAVSLVATGLPVTASASGFDGASVDTTYFATANVTGGVAVALTEAGKATTGAVHIPAEIDGKPVIAINPSGFADAKASAIHFENSDLIQTIGNYAFYNAEATNAVSFQNVAVIPENSFNNSQFSAVQLNSGVVTTIGANAFTNAHATNAISLNSVTDIPKEAFKGSKFSSITLGADLQTVGESAFEGTQATNAIALDNLKTIPTKAFADSLFNTITVGDTVTTLGESAFHNAGATNAITLNGLTNVPKSAFENASFSAINVDGSKVTSLGANAFANTKATNVMTLDAITAVPLNAFKGSQFSEIHLNAAKVKTVGISAFQDAQATNDVVLTNVTMISDNAFTGAQFSLIALTPATLTSVSTSAFTADLDAVITEQELKGKTSTIKVDPLTQVNVTSIKYATGTQTPLFFDTGGTDITGASEFTVSENGTYTVFVQDGAKRATVKTFTVKNVDKVPPTVILTEQSTWGNTTVAVNVNATDGAGVGTIKWLEGNKTLADFENAGTDVVDNTFNATDNGIYTVYVSDVIGNATVQTITVSKMDKTPPALTLSEQADVGTTTTVNALATDGEAGMATLQYAEGSYTADDFPVQSATEFTATKSFTVDKNATYTVMAIDAAGNRTVKEITTTKVDLTPPTVALSVDGGTSAKSHTTTVTANDDNAVASLEYQWSTSATDTSADAWVVVANGDAVTTTEGATGTYYLHVKATDGLGNVTNLVSKEFIVDNTPPAAPTFTATETTQTNKDVSVAIDFGVDSELSQYRVNGGSWQPYITAISMTTNGTIDARATDVAGNVSAEVTYTMDNIDKVAPTLSAAEQQTWGQKTTVSVTANDAGFGIASVKYAKGNFTNESFPPLDTTDITATMAFEVTENATYTILVTDKVGNKTAYVLTTTKADAEAPTIKLTEQAFAGKNSTVTVNVTDAHSGILETKWLSGLKTVTDFATAGELLSATGNFTVSENGIYSVYAKDNVGNETVETITVAQIDVTPPTVTVTEQAAWDANQSKITVNPTDNLSGVAKVKWLLGTRTVEDFAVAGTDITGTNEFTATSNGVYTVFVEDSAGNGIVQTITVSKIDVTAPTATAVEQADWGKTTTVTVTADDVESGVQKISYVKGTFTANTFPSGATDITASKTFTVNENTAYTILVTDKVGNSEAIVVETKKADTTPVALTLAEQETISKTATVTVNALEAQSGISSIKWLSGLKTVNDFASAGADITTAKELTATDNGIYTVYAKDNVGNETVKTISVSNIDVTNPTVALSAALNWGITSTITVEPFDDHAGVKAVKWLSGTKTATDFANAGTDITETNQFTVTENGWYTVYVEDYAGNFVVDTIEITQVDTTLPTVTLVEQSQWDSASSTVTVIPLDDLADVHVVKWLSGNLEVADFVGAGNDITAAKEFTVTDNGVYTVYIEDKAGNKVVQPIVVAKVDKTAPTVTYTEQNAWGQTTKVNVSPKDVGSGVASVTYIKGTHTVADFPTTGATNITTTKAFTVSENATYTILIEDKVGNKSVQLVTTTKADTTAPTLKVTPQQDLAKNTTVTVVAEDDQSGVAMIKWLEGSKAVADFASAGAEITAASNFTVESNGVYTVYVKDSVGNERIETVTVQNMDNVAPNLVVTEQKTWGESATLTVTATDDMSGIKAVKWLTGAKTADDFLTDGVRVTDGAFEVTANGIYTVYAEDNLGNIVTQQVTVSMVDATIPAVNLTEQLTSGQTSTVTVTATETASGTKVIKWLEGNKTEADFADAGVDITDAKVFEATANGVYTVYIENNVGGKSVETITVKNVVDAPIIGDTSAPTITVTLPTEINTQADITVKVTDADAEVAEVKWLAGEKSVADFTTVGELVTNDTITVTSNGSYTIYAVDANGNATVKVIEVTTIDTDSPNITLTSKVTGEGEATVTIVAVDPSPITEIKWLEGTKSVEDFKTAGTVVTDGSFKVTETGEYTVYVVDALGQASVETITVDTLTDGGNTGGTGETGGGTGGNTGGTGETGGGTGGNTGGTGETGGGTGGNTGGTGETGGGTGGNTGGTGETGGGTGGNTGGTGETGGGTGGNTGGTGETGGGTGGNTGGTGETGGGTGGNTGGTGGGTGGNTGGTGGTGGGTGGNTGETGGTGGGTGGNTGGTGGGTGGNTGETGGTGGGTGNTDTPPFELDITTDDSSDVIITIPDDVADGLPNGSSTVIITDNKVYVEINGEKVEVGKLGADVDIKNLRAYRSVEGQPTTVMHYTANDELRITTPNGLKDVIITSRENIKFTDVPADSWHVGYVTDLYNYAIIKGTTATTFAPNQAITRGQFATMVARAMELSNVNATNYTLTDLDGKAYANSVQALMDLNIITGFEDGTFRGGDTITRQQAVAMLGRMMTHLNVDASPTSTVQLADMKRVSDYAKDYVEYFAENNVINSGIDVKFNPKDNVTRAQLSKMLLNALRLSDFY